MLTVLSSLKVLYCTKYSEVYGYRESQDYGRLNIQQYDLSAPKI